MSGRLYLCATPIGNLEDITLRVLNTLRDVDLIAAEDTRHSRILLEHYEITTPLTSYHEHNKYEKAEILVEKMQRGMQIALITDAGTPAISDPGEELVRQALQAGLPVTSLPGACACITALTMSGLPARRFVFEAFLPAEKKERREVLERLKTECRTIVLYEAPHHLRRTLEELTEALGDRRVTICRELTKKYEEGIQTTLVGAQTLYREEEPRGEFVLVLEGRSPEELREEAAQSYAEMTLHEHLQRYLETGMERKEAMKQVARDRNCSRREVYQGLLQEEDG
ncbi:MAG: 16S rRNA (cytidine(1402)-2'-O)-methyltransferase [Lachnospiraceae bacterium]|nr:16S rRNA (cytidine(1402)-2'-O)-methyltransferase [Lachnospiraceae bacterium]